MEGRIKAHELAKILLSGPDGLVRLKIGNPKTDVQADPLSGVTCEVLETGCYEEPVIEIEGWATNTKMYVEQGE